MEEILVLKLQLDASSTIKTTDDLIKRNKELAKLLKSAPREGEEGFEELKDSIEAASAEFANNRVEIKKFNDGLKDVEVAADSMKGLSKTLKQLEAEYKSLSKEEREAFGDDIKQKIVDTREELKDLEADLGDYRRNVGNYPETTKANFFDLGETIKSIGVAAAAALTFDLAKDAIANIAAVTEEFEALRGSIQQLSGATGPELDSFTTDLAAIANTFGESTDEVLLAANALTENLTGDFGESLRLIEEGFLSGANANGEFLGSLEESSALIAETGATADEFIGIISQSAREGIFSDKGVKTVQEAGKLLREQNKATQDSIIELFGEAEGKELLGQIDTGEVNIIDAVAKVSERIGELEPQSQLAGEAIKNIFGRGGQKAGIDFVTSLKDVSKGTEGLIDTTNELTSSQISNLAAEKQLATAQNETSKRLASAVTNAGNLATIFKGVLFSALNVVIDILSPAVNAIGALGSKLFELIDTLGLTSLASGAMSLVISGLSLVFKGIGFAIGEVVELIGFLIDGINFVSSGFLFLVDSIDSATGVFTFFKNTIASIPATFSGVVAAVKQLGTNLLDFFSTIALNAQIFAKEIEGIFTFDASATDTLNREIQALVQQKQDIAAAGKTIGEAFNEGFNESIAALDAANALEEVPVEQPAEEAGAKAGKSFNKGFNKEVAAEAGSVSALGEKVTKLQGLLDKLVPGSDKFLETAEKIKKAIEELDVAEDIKKAALSTEEVLAIQENALVKLREQVGSLNNELDNLVPGSESFLEVAEKIKLATEKLTEAEALRTQAVKTEEELIAEREAAAEKLEQTLERFAKERLQNRQNQISEELALEKLAAQQIRDEKLANEKLTADEREAIVEDFNNSVLQSELQAEKLRLDLLAEGSVERLNLQAEIADKELAIRQKFYEEDVAKNAEAEQKKQESRKMFQDIAFEVANTIADAAFAIEKQNLEREVNQRIEALDKETEAKLAAASGSEQEQIRIREEAEQKKQAIEKDAAKKRKEQAIIQAVINGALAAISTLANTTVPYPAAFALLIPTAVAVAAQIAVISGQQFKRGKAPGMPEYGKGGLPRGRTHAQGGIAARVGGVEPVEIEDHEALVNRVSSMRHLQLLSDINQDGGGIRYPGTERITQARRQQLSLYGSIQKERPILAERGLAPRLPALRMRKFQDGVLATVAGTKVEVPGISEQDSKMIALACEIGTKRGIEAANLYENFKRQLERESEIDDRAKV